MKRPNRLIIPYLKGLNTAKKLELVDFSICTVKSFVSLTFVFLLSCCVKPKETKLRDQHVTSSSTMLPNIIILTFILLFELVKSAYFFE